MMTGKRILILLTSHSVLGNTGKATGLWLEELTTPYYVFLDAGAIVDIASLKGGKVPIDPASQAPVGENPPSVERFMQDYSAMAQLEDSKSLSELAVGNYTAIFLPGGHGTMFDMAESPELGTFLSTAWARGGVLAAVCHGPAGLINVMDEHGHSILKGSVVTGFSNSEEEKAGLTQAVPFLLENRLKELGADYLSGEDFQSFAVSDGHLITGQNPQSSEETAKLVLAALDDE